MIISHIYLSKNTWGANIWRLHTFWSTLTYNYQHNILYNTAWVWYVVKIKRDRRDQARPTIVNFGRAFACFFRAEWVLAMHVVCVLRFLKMASQGNWSITYSSVVHEKSSKLCVRAHDYLVTILYHIKLE